ncbi:MAG: sporulation integral membrane protein YtvI [Clostridiaceae bacterium]|nr:sporulation integral membrane protein YtvI [Clostridiaceae bacterium]
MQDTLKKTLSTILKVVLVIVVFLLSFRIVKYIVPFLLAYFFASLIEPIVKFIERKLRIPRKVGTVFSILFVLGTFFSIIGFLIYRLIKEIENVYYSININVDGITSFFNRLISEINIIFIQLPEEITEILNQAARNLAVQLQDLLNKVFDIAQMSIKFALNLPQIIIFILVTILATYFMSSDKTKILNFLDVQIPSNWLKKTRGITSNIFTALFGWIRAQFILMIITFSELLVGLLVIGIENPLLIALTIAVVDVLPVLGAGTVLIPWGIVNIIFGNTKLGLSLLLLYVIILFVRQLIEPKIVGQQIGVHPLLTLFGMYVGLQIFGVLGLFAGPIIVVIIRYVVVGLTKADSFKNWFETNFHTNRKVVLSTDINEQADEKKSENRAGSGK